MNSTPGRITSLAAAIGAAFTVHLAPLPAAAAGNPFGYSHPGGGYMIADHDGARAEGKCGPGKCGVQRMDADHDDRVSKAEFMKAHRDESKFAALDANHDGFLDAGELKKMQEGKCGEGKCGVSK